MISPNTELLLGYSRIVLLAREGVKLSIMDEYMGDEIPAIWVKLVTRGRKPLVIGGIYREFHLLLQPDPNNTDDKKLQIIRWNKTITGWGEKQLETLDTLCLVT